MPLHLAAPLCVQGIEGLLLRHHHAAEPANTTQQASQLHVAARCAVSSCFGCAAD
jgi:hypothetical protein